jgi:precorrin-2/cobalt-factor-2 C20-methyltransferase
MKLYVLGLGPGDPELISVKASKVLSTIDLLFIPYSLGTRRSLAMEIVNKYISPKVEVVQIGFPMEKNVKEEKMIEIARLICKKMNRDAAFAVLGDPTLYSTFFRISKYIDCAELEIIPGITSITACASRALIPLANGDEAIAIITSSRVDLLKQVKEDFDTIIVLKASENVKYILEELKDHSLVYARRCFMNDEIILKDKINEEEDYFTTIIAKRFKGSGR